MIHILTWERRKLSYLQCPELIPEIFWRQAINFRSRRKYLPQFYFASNQNILYKDFQIMIIFHVHLCNTENAFADLFV